MTNNKFNCIISERISTLRKDRNLTIEQLAYQSGISKGGLSEIERNLKEPRLFTILKICSALNISLSDFFNFDSVENFARELQ